MHRAGWRRWFPLAIVFGMTVTVNGWIAHWHQQSRITRLLPRPNESTPSTAIQTESSAALIGIAAPVESPSVSTLPDTQTNNAVNHIRERAHLLAWFISIALILYLAGRILESSQEVEFTNLTTWLTVASLLVLLSGSAALVITWHKTFVWPRWLWRFSGLGAAALISLSAVQIHLSL